MSAVPKILQNSGIITHPLSAIPQWGTHLYPVSAPGHLQQCSRRWPITTEVTTAGNAPVPGVSPRSPSTVRRRWPITTEVTTAGNAPVTGVSPRSRSTVLRRWPDHNRRHHSGERTCTRCQPPVTLNSAEGAGRSQQTSPQWGTHLYPVSAPGHPQQCSGAGLSQLQETP